VVVFDGDTFSIVETAESLDIYNFCSAPVSWSPDGRFLLLYHGASAYGPSAIAIAEFSDGRVTALDVDVGQPGGICPWPRPEWSPDGRYIAYVQSDPTADHCEHETESSIMVVSFPDGRVTDVTASLGGRNDLIGWIPDTSDRP